MRFVDRILWLYLSLVLTACSLVTEFPEPLDGGPGTNARDAGRGGSAGIVCEDDSKCGRNALCCGPGSDGKKHCVPVDENQCTQCAAAGSSTASNSAGACRDEKAPLCGNRECECEPGKGPCRGDTICDKERAKCVGCRSNEDCAGQTNGRNTCVDGECAQCDRKDPANPQDDEGCGPKTPICNEDLVCVGCTPNTDDCPEGQQCVPGNGCFGCSPEPGKTFPDNGCKTPTNPVCIATGGGFQCAGCGKNEDCGSGIFCDEVTGSCHNNCDPNAVPGQTANGCRPEAPICKPGPNNVYACQGCAVGDPCPTGTTCSLVAPTAGQCVSNAVACTPPLVVLANGQCGCSNNMSCVGNAAGPLCGPTGTCGPCVAGLAGDAACRASNMATPYCSAGACVACRTSENCGGATPICSAAGACVPCTTLVGPAANAACAAISRRTPFCVTSGPTPGGCAACSPGAAITDSTCEASNNRAGFCYAAVPNGPLVCNQCIRDLPITSPDPCTGLIGANACRLDDDVFVCPRGLLDGLLGR